MCGGNRPSLLELKVIPQPVLVIPFLLFFAPPTLASFPLESDGGQKE